MIYCVDDASKDANVFRYSQDQRRKETKMKKYNNIILGMKTNKIQGKLKFGRHINIKRNEQKMMSEFKKMYGNPENVVICIGDWEQRKQMKYNKYVNLINSILHIIYKLDHMYRLFPTLLIFLHKNIYCLIR